MFMRSLRGEVNQTRFFKEALLRIFSKIFTRHPNFQTKKLPFLVGSKEAKYLFVKDFEWLKKEHSLSNDFWDTIIFGF